MVAAFLLSVRYNAQLTIRNMTAAAPADIHKALLAGLLSHVGSKDPDSFEYRGARGARFSINPGSGIETATETGDNDVVRAGLTASYRRDLTPDWAMTLGLSWRMVDEDTVERFEESVRATEQILECYLLTGSSDYLLHVAGESLAKVYKEF